jgi:uncharacterized UPF0160 family protein
MPELKNYAMTHGGKFHADDVFSAALLKIINPSIKIIRTFEVPEDFDGIVFDIGYGKFDHHQEGAEVRVNGVPYAAFGLLWREFGESVITACSSEQTVKEAARFDEKFIQPLDEDDNTGCGNQLAGVIGAFNPSWDSDQSKDECFEEAVDFATVILKKKFDSMISIQKAKELVEAALAKAKDNIVILPRFAPWKMVVVPSDAEFVVYPSQRGGYSAQVVPINLDTKEAKCDFPEEGAGKSENELQEISGVRTLTFCHKGRFLISADHLDDVVKACKFAQNRSHKS